MASGHILFLHDNLNHLWSRLAISPYKYFQQLLLFVVIEPTINTCKYDTTVVSSYKATLNKGCLFLSCQIVDLLDSKIHVLIIVPLKRGYSYEKATFSLQKGWPYKRGVIDYSTMLVALVVKQEKTTDWPISNLHLLKII